MDHHLRLEVGMVAHINLVYKVECGTDADLVNMGAGGPFMNRKKLNLNLNKINEFK
jgi:hypothetical protein